MGQPRRALRVFSQLFLAGALTAARLAAQSPIGNPFLVPPAPGLIQAWQEQTTLANGDLLVAWLESTFQEPDPIVIRGQHFSLHAGPGEAVSLAEGMILADTLVDLLVAPRADGGFLLTFNRFLDRLFAGCRARAFGVLNQPLAAEVTLTPSGGCGEGLVALEDGTFGLMLYERTGIDRAESEYRLFARLSPSGELLNRPRRVNPNPRRVDGTFGTLAGNARGEMTYIWDGFHPNVSRSFHASGGPLPPVTVVRFTDGQTPRAAVAVTPSGVRIYAGFNFILPDINYPAYQLFSPDGTPLTRVRPAITPRDALFGDQVVAADRFGNFVIAWASIPGTFDDRVEARLFRADGTPVAKEFFAGVTESSGFRPQVSFGNDGTFALSWVDETGLELAWFSASPADEPCLTRGGRLHCDTGRTGGESEIDQPDAPSGAEPLFLADYDGDGRADPCFRFGTTFHCDLEHRGRGPRARVRFGEPGDVPLMGDVDGDGRADACVRRGDLLACDTAHDGGRAEFEEHFGSPGDTPLLGDVNGDRRDDLCLFHDGVFACDTAHDGGGAEVTIHFGHAGDLPVLGDFDGDGRDDPCVLSGNTLLCDTKHDGGAAEGVLVLTVQPGDGIVMGNLDGL